MTNSQFYLINSKKSNEEVNGLKKITFGCSNRANSYGFIWIDDENNIQHIQFIFGEIVLEWLPKKGLRYRMTNRVIEAPDGKGFQKGVRTLLPIENKDLIKDAIEEAQTALYPMEWSKKILEKFYCEN